MMCIKMESLHATLRKEKGFFNPARVILVASGLPNNVHTSRSITLLDQYYSNVRQNINNNKLSHVLQVKRL